MIVFFQTNYFYKLIPRDLGISLFSRKVFGILILGILFEGFYNNFRDVVQRSLN